jgi:serine/threonine-protein kinase HipA
MTTATVYLWGMKVGVVAMNDDEAYARFEYDPDFVKLGLEVAPITMPLKEKFAYIFRDLEHHTFFGLPGLLADSLPDKYGQKLINIWLAQTGQKAKDFNAAKRLCYMGSRGMGALEFQPTIRETPSTDQKLEVSELVSLASMALSTKGKLETNLDGGDNENAIMDIISVGTSAGGARAKAVIALNPDTKEVRSGQLPLLEGFEHWLIKFDGVEFNGDWGVTDPIGYGLLEYSYYKMAKRCGIAMMESDLFQEGSRSHFMTKRFDRDNDDKKAFVQTLGAIAHFDYWESGAYSYEQVFMVMKELGLKKSEMEEQLRRMIFNFVGCNQDDHVKNISFMMDTEGNWYLSPAYDLCHAEGSQFTKNHQLSLNNKVNDFTLKDLKHAEEYAGLPRGRANRILGEIIEAFKEWDTLALELSIPKNIRDHVNRTLRLNWN